MDIFQGRRERTNYSNKLIRDRVDGYRCGGQRILTAAKRKDYRALRIAQGRLSAPRLVSVQE